MLFYNDIESCKDGYNIFKIVKTFRSNNERGHSNGSPCVAIGRNTAAARTRHVLQRGDPKNLDRVRGELEQSVTLLLEVHTNNIMYNTQTRSRVQYIRRYIMNVCVRVCLCSI